ncbi:hypothetical protein LOTGIDRAFT_169349 [Lottia gigantea]|uniref:Ig-like domain-containing protein n=1 Tax=Lottia gigantea TaxID=225164 RepID=V3ZGQ0_LOTGI|nr:hypothetical protein LOTGIDRAFT_169349 [Lottia gigantea]ESO83327.1 hypothetical protein LOTGIDRAFT_169349 [Lottia gigantea]
MMYFYLGVYYLFIFWIQGGETDPMTIGASSTTVSPGEIYNITCHAGYKSFKWKKNNNFIVNQTCQFEKDVKEGEYHCVSNESTSHQTGYVLTLQVNAELSPGRVQWYCVHPDGYNKSLNITVENHDTRSRGRTHNGKTPSPTQSSRQVNKPSSSSSSPGQPPVSSNNNVHKQPKNFNIILIAICCAVVVLVLVITLIAVLFLYSKLKKDRAKRGSTRPIAREPRGFPAEGNYDDIDNLPPPKYDWTVRDDDFVSLHDTLDADGVPESSNPNFDASLLYGVVMKGPVADPMASHIGGEAEKSNPNFDADRVYGVVDKSAKCQYPVFDSKIENVYANQ